MSNQNKTDDGETLEVALKKTIQINQIQGTQNVVRKNDLKEEVTSIRKNLKKGVISSEKPYKGKLMKCSMRSVKMDIENKTKAAAAAAAKSEPKPKNVITKKSSENFIERLKQIEKVIDGENFLDQTNEEIDIASKQLEEIQKLLTDKLQQAEIRNKKNNAREDRKSRYHQHVMMDKVSRQLERMQKAYLNKTKVHYKSLKDVESLTDSRSDYKIPEKIKYHEAPAEEDEVKVYWTKNKILKAKPKAEDKDTTSSETQTQSNFKKWCHSSPIILEEKKSKSIISSESSIAKTLDKSKKLSQFSSSFAQKRRSALILAQLDDIPELSPSEASDGEKSSTSELEYSDELNLTKHIFASSKCTESSKTELDNKASDSLEEDLTSTTKGESCSPEENTDEFLLNKVWKNLDESILKSEYLSREFSIDLENKFSSKVDKAAEKRSMQLFGTTRRKFQDQQICRLANLKRRDQKLYTALNLALKDTLFAEISQ